MVNDELIRFFGQLEGLMQMTIKDVEKIEKSLDEINDKFHEITLNINSIDQKLDEKINNVDNKVDSWIGKIKGAWWTISALIGFIGAILGIAIKLLI